MTMIRFSIRVAAVALLILAANAFAQEAPDPQLVAEAVAIPTPAPLPGIRMIGDRVYAELPPSGATPARWAFSPLDAWLAGKPVWTTALALTPPEGEKAWKLVAVHCLGIEQARCLLQPGPGDGRTALIEYDVRANRVPEGGFTLPLGKRDVAWDDVDHLLITDPAKPERGLVRWARGAALASASPWFATDAAGGAIWPNLLTDSIGSRTVLVAQETGAGRRHMWTGENGRLHPLALPESAWVAGLVQGQAVVTTGDAPWQGGGVPAFSVAVLPLGELAAARPRGVRVLFTASPDQQLSGAHVVRAGLYVSYRDRMRGRVRAFAWRRGAWAAVPARLPENSAIGFVAGNDTHDFAIFGERRFVGGEQRWRVTPNGGARRIGEAGPADAMPVAVRQFVARAPDGTRLPYFVIARTDARADAPVLVTGDGAWGNVREPAELDRFGQLWVRRGGVLVDAIVRGGGEFGEGWHRAATGARRPVSFGDFRAITDDLVRRGLARDGRMGLVGGDNFGLLALDAMIAAPRRWRALWLSDPIADLEQVTTLGVDEADRPAMAAEYGDVAAPGVAAALAAANPLRRLRGDTRGPAVLVMRSRNDPWNRGGHSLALEAALHRAGIAAVVEETPGDYEQWRTSPERAARALQFLVAAGLDPKRRGRTTD